MKVEESKFNIGDTVYAFGHIGIKKVIITGIQYRFDDKDTDTLCVDSYTVHDLDTDNTFVFTSKVLGHNIDELLDYLRQDAKSRYL